MDWILFSPFDWDDTPRRPHALARALAAKDPVLWVNPPPSLLRKPRFGLRLREANFGVTVLDLPGGIPGRRSAWVDRLNQTRWLRVLQRALPQIHHPMQPLAVLLETPFAHTMAQGLGAELLLYDAWEDWRQAAPRTAPDPVHVERVLANAADAVLVPSVAAGRRFAVNGATVQVLHGGCRPLPPLGSVLPIPTMEKKAGPHFVFIGTVDDCFDIELLRASASEIPEAHWWILGDLVGGEARKLLKTRHVRVVGRVPETELPRWLAGADACILPVFQGEGSENRDWPQLYQYLASGLPVVSVALSVAEAFDDLVEIAHPELVRGFADACRRALARDMPALQERRRAAADSLTWEACAETLRAYARKHVPTRAVPNPAPLPLPLPRPQRKR